MPEHLIQTRLRIGIVERKNYVALVVICPEFQSLQVTDEDPSVKGFSFLSKITNSIEPSCFRKAASISHWQIKCNAGKV